MRNAVYLLFYLFAVGVFGLGGRFYSLAHAADLDWLYSASNCDQLSLGITKHFARQSSGNMTPEGRAELRVVLFEGCGPRFVECNLSVCDQAALLEAAEPRPLDWINSVNNCDEFKREFKKRYSFLRSFKGLDPDLQIELDYIFYRACAENFEECTFSQCNPVSSAKVTTPTPEELNELDSQLAAEVMNAVVARSELEETVDPSTGADELQHEAVKDAVLLSLQEKEGDSKTAEEIDPLTVSSEAEFEFRSRMIDYDRVVAEGLLERAAAVEMQMAAEKERDLQWVTAANPDELETLRKRREQEATERRSPQSGAVSPRTGLAPAPRPPRNTPHYRGNTPQQRRAPVKPRIKIQDSGGPLTY